VITVVPRLPIGLERLGGWGDTTLQLPSGIFHNQFVDRARPCSGPVALGQLLGSFPVALLVAE
jgi:(1->4)-alpha-D-glucan 1-alpha-D-glucosylmutase